MWKLIPGLQEQPGWQEGSPSALLPLHKPWDCVDLCWTGWDRAGMGWASPPPRKWDGKGFDECAGTWFCALPVRGLTLCSVLQCPICYGGFTGACSSKTHQAVLLGKRCLGEASGGCRAMVKELLAPQQLLPVGASLGSSPCTSGQKTPRSFHPSEHLAAPSLPSSPGLH